MRKIVPIVVCTLLAGCLPPQPAPMPPVRSSYQPPANAEEVYARIKRQGMQVYQEHANKHNGKGDRVQGSEVIPDDDIRHARLLLRMRRGALWVEGGGSDLVNAKLTHMENQPVPQVLSVTSGFSRRVEIIARGQNDQWNLQVGDRVPVSFLVEAEAGYRNLNLDDLLVSEVNLQAGRGVTVLSTLGEQDFLTGTSISHAFGPIAMDMSGEYDLLYSVNADTADGDIAGIFRGYYRRLRHINIETTKGDVELDLTGAWRETCQVRITCTNGNCTLFVPKGLGVSVKVRTECGKTYGPCLQKKWSSGAYINEAYEKTRQFLDIEVHTSAGYVNVVEVG